MNIHIGPLNYIYMLLHILCIDKQLYYYQVCIYLLNLLYNKFRILRIYLNIDEFFCNFLFVDFYIYIYFPHSKYIYHYFHRSLYLYIKYTHYLYQNFSYHNYIHNNHMFLYYKCNFDLIRMIPYYKKHNNYHFLNHYLIFDLNIYYQCHLYNKNQHREFLVIYLFLLMNNILLFLLVLF